MLATVSPISLEQPVTAATSQALDAGKTPSLQAFSGFLRAFSDAPELTGKLPDAGGSRHGPAMLKETEAAHRLPETGKALPLLALHNDSAISTPIPVLQGHSQAEPVTETAANLTRSLLSARQKTERPLVPVQGGAAARALIAEPDGEQMISVLQSLHLAQAGTDNEAEPIQSESLFAGKTPAPLVLSSEQGGIGMNPGAVSPVERLQTAPGFQVQSQTPTFQLSPRLEDAEFSQALGQRLLLQVKDQLQFARLALNPPELGPVDVRVEVNRDVASVNFITASSQVREALEDAIPRLREQFAAAGLSLGQADVSSGERGAADRSAEDAGESVSMGEPETGQFEADTPVSGRTYAIEGLVDAYA